MTISPNGHPRLADQLLMSPVFSCDPRTKEPSLGGAEPRRAIRELQCSSRDTCVLGGRRNYNCSTRPLTAAPACSGYCRRAIGYANPAKCTLGPLLPHINEPSMSAQSHRRRNRMSRCPFVTRSMRVSGQDSNYRFKRGRNDGFTRRRRRMRRSWHTHGRRSSNSHHGVAMAVRRGQEMRRDFDSQREWKRLTGLG